MKTIADMKPIISIIVIIIVTVWVTRLFSPPTEPWAKRPLLSADAPALILSCADLQRELNRRDPTLKLVVDGVCGPKTMNAWNEAVNTQFALMDWPEDVK